MNESLHMKPYPDIPRVGMGGVKDKISLSRSHVFFHEPCFINSVFYTFFICSRVVDLIPA